MRRKVRALYVAREFLDWRADHFISGESLESEEWIFRLRGVVGMLVDVGLVEPKDWLLPGQTVLEKAGKLQWLRDEVKSRMWLRAGEIEKLEYKITIDLIDKISVLVVEMAVLGMAMQVGVDALAEYFEGSRRRIRSKEVALRSEADKARFLVPLFWFSPEVHLAEAKAGLVRAKEEVVRAQDRVRKALGNSERGDVIKPVPHKAMLIDMKKADRLRKKMATKRDGLFADLAPDEPGRMNASK